MFKTAFMGMIAVSTLLGCDKDAGKEKQKEDPVASEEKKQAQIDALLRENGSAPVAPADPAAALKPTEPAPAVAAPAPGAPAGAQGSALQIKLISAGSGPKQKLSYSFKVGRKRNFAMDMEVASGRVTNGQKEPGPPPITLALTGTTETFEASATGAKRMNTFADFSAKAADLPPEIEAQMKQQFAMLKGTQLIETDSSRGEVLDLQIRDMSQMNPVVLGLIQNLKDGMTNQFMPLPAEEVGAGAKWVSTTSVEASGMTITQETEVELLSLQGTKATARLTMKQTAPAQKLQDPRLPPGTTIELLKLEGGGDGEMTVDFAEMIIDAKSNLKMSVDTQVSGGPVPTPQKTLVDTSMKMHVKLTK